MPCQGNVRWRDCCRNAVASWFLYVVLSLIPTQVPGAELQWWKGNLHTHTLWSDGDGLPEVVADWYKTRGYHFLALSDHNLMQYGEKWVNVTNLPGVALALEHVEAKFGEGWIQKRWYQGLEQVRLKTLDEIRGRLEEKNRFVLIPSSEITTAYKIWPIHVNASNLRYAIAPPPGGSVYDALQRCIDAVMHQREATGQIMIPHVNHPNFGWAITAEDLIPLRGEKFFEVYNGHPLVHNEGDGTRVGTEAIWDAVLAIRLSQTKLGPLYGLAVDDAHHYSGDFEAQRSNPGRGWIMVRSAKLDPASLLSSMERGDFYATTGVILEDVKRERRRLTVVVHPEDGVEHRIRFIGTPIPFNAASTPILATDGRPYPTTRRYSHEVGMLFQEVPGDSASFELTGKELYVRAVVISSKAKRMALHHDEREMAWTQPLVYIP